ncbi:MAG: heparinase II/III family protein, partial [Lentisphaeria bacterium]|nr:heparinase II/III family protein [Lentisphaeria bacterium]
FLDIFDMAGTPNRDHRTNWFAQPEDVKDWGNPEIDSWSLQKKRTKIAYGCLHFGRSFVARFWETGNPVYRDKMLEIMDDFVLNHHRLFWEAYARGEVHSRNRQVGNLYYTDWRDNVNALDTAVRARNMIVFNAGLAKCLGDGKSQEWESILRPVENHVSRAQAEALPADQMANSAISLIEHHGPKIIRFVSGACIPNQRLTGLKTLLSLSATYPNFRHTPPLLKAFRLNIDKILEDNYLPDGGNLEQSFNYNHGELRELEVILSSFGANAPPFADKLRERVQARRAIDDGLRTPLGGLPQVGNHSSFTSTGKDTWSSPKAAAAYRAYRQERKQLAQPEPQDFLSKGYPYSGYYAMRGGWGMTDPYLFFMAGRPQSGHAMHDSNSIQIVANGRNLVVCDGAPTYGYRHTPEAEYAAFAVSEQCGWKVNSVMVDGKCQARDEKSYSTAPQTPVRCRWHTSSIFDVMENLCDRGYWNAQKPHGKPDHAVAHRRTVVFLRAAGFWLMEDRMVRKDDTPHTYAQTWNFLPKTEHADYARRHIDGFEPEQFELQPNQKRFATADPDGPNLEFIHITPGPVVYKKYFG